MEKKSNDFIKSLNNVRDEIIKEIKRLLKSYGIKSLNAQPYYANDYVCNWMFYDCDKDGNGEGLECDLINVEGNTVILTMYTTYGSYFGTCFLTDLTTCDTLYVLQLIEDIVEIHEKEGLPILKEGEDFEEM